MTAVFLHIATPAGGPIGATLARACARAGVAWSCFLTNDGVRALENPDVVAALKPAARAAVCEHSWRQHMHDAPCPVELGSQTINSALMAEAGRVVSL
jgi:hypothetical protein